MFIKPFQPISSKLSSQDFSTDDNKNIHIKEKKVCSDLFQLFKWMCDFPCSVNFLIAFKIHIDGFMGNFLDVVPLA